MLKALFLAGVDTFRLNFSHGVQADHARVHAAIRALEAEVRADGGDDLGVAVTTHGSLGHRRPPLQEWVRQSGSRGNR
jgi:pyruvate kinase